METVGECLMIISYFKICKSLWIIGFIEYKGLGKCQIRKLGARYIHSKLAGGVKGGIA